LTFSVLVGETSIFQVYFKILKILILHNCQEVKLSSTLESWQKIMCTPVIFLTIRSKSKFCIHTTAVCISQDSVKVTECHSEFAGSVKFYFIWAAVLWHSPSPQATFQLMPPKKVQALPRNTVAAHNLLL
jgi:hypothetical protein